MEAFAQETVTVAVWAPDESPEIFTELVRACELPDPERVTACPRP